jgi:RNA polymerase sigma factor (TIGR02999 family)
VSGTESGDITLLLRAHRDGDAAAFDALVGRIHEELRVLARRQLRGAPSLRTLDSVALVNEAYLRLAQGAPVAWEDRHHFFGIAARVMRLVVVDALRAHLAQKRGGGVAWTTLDPETAGGAAEADVVLAVARAVEKLESFNERLARVVECRFFGGMSEEEISAALGVSVRSVQRDWTRARAWLQRELEA